MRVAELISISLDGFFSGERGCYVYVVPEDFSVFKQIFVKMFPELKLTTDTDIHCTVMYSPEGTPDKDAAFSLLDDSKEFTAVASELVYWDGHNNAGYLVLKLSSGDLFNRHSSWKSLGAIPTFADYTPHVTVATGFTMTPEFEQKVQEFNTYLSGWSEDRKKLIFSNEHIEDIKG